MIVATQKTPAQQTDAKKLHLSASQLKTFTMCSLQWLLSRHHKPELVGSGLRFGGAFHKALQAFYQGRLEGREVTQEHMLDAYSAAWVDEAKRFPDVPVKFAEDETQEGLHELASRMLGAFLSGVQPSQVIAVEEPFEVPLAPGLPPLIGFIDLVEVREDESSKKVLWLCDHKTAAKRPTEDSLESDQVILYGLGLARTGVLKEFQMPLALRYDVITKTKKPELVSVQVKPSRHDAERLIEKAGRIWKAMSAEAVWPSAGWWCQGCGHQTLCAKWPKI